MQFLLGDEKYILQTFWELWQDWCSRNATIVTFNGSNFDIPFAVRRSHAISVEVPVRLIWTTQTRRWYRDSVIDLMQIWCGMGGWAAGKNLVSLGDLGKFLELGGKEGNGAAFADLLKNDRQAALSYLRRDVTLTSEIATRILGPVNHNN